MNLELHVKIAKLCGAIYSDDQQLIASTFDRVWDHRGTIAGHVMIDGRHWIVFRATKVALDVILDMAAHPLLDPQLGFVHAGFMLGVRETIATFRREFPDVTAASFGGHSLGGARASLGAGIWMHCGYIVDALVTMGSPRPAFDELDRAFDKRSVRRWLYWNRRDRVPLVPFPIRFVQPWAHTAPITRLDSPADPADITYMRDHHLPLYIDGLDRLQRGEPADPMHDALDALAVDRQVFGRTADVAVAA